MPTVVQASATLAVGNQETRMGGADMPERTVSLYDNIVSEVKRKQMTLEDFCRLMGISRRTLLNWKDNDDLVPSSFLMSTAKLFNVTLDYLARDVPVKEVIFDE